MGPKPYIVYHIQHTNTANIAETTYIASTAYISQTIATYTLVPTVAQLNTNMLVSAPATTSWLLTYNQESIHGSDVSYHQ